MEMPIFIFVPHWSSLHRYSAYCHYHRYFVFLHRRRKCRKHHLTCLIHTQFCWITASRELACGGKRAPGETAVMGPDLTRMATNTSHQRARLCRGGRHLGFAK